MKSFKKTPYIRDGKKWYFLSIYYSRDKWIDLIDTINLFYHKRQNQFCICLICFSKIQGENIQLTLGTPANDCNNYINEIEFHFKSFMELHPSISNVPFNFGKAIWGNYPNNSITWNIFKITDFSNQYVNFHRQTVELVCKLLKNDFSENNFITVEIYLIIRGLLCINCNEQKDVLYQLLDKILNDARVSINTVKELICKMDINEINRINKTIVSYKNENVSTYSMHLLRWLDTVTILLKTYPFNKFYYIIHKILGLSGTGQIITLQILHNTL